jgi:chromosome segregation ATPase
VTGLFPVKEMSSSEALGLGQALGVRDKKIEKLEAVLAQEQKLTAHLERQLTLRQKQIADLEEIVADRDATQDDFAKRVRELLVEKTKQATTIGILYEQLDGVQADLSSMRDNRDALVDQLVAMSSQVKDLTIDRDTLIGRNRNLEEKNGNQMKIIEQLQSDVKLVSETVDAQADRYIVLQHKHGELQATLAQNQALVRGHGQRVEDLTKMNHNQAAVIQNQQDEIVDLKRHRDVTASQQKDTINYQLKKIDAHEKEIRRLKDGWHKANKELDELQTIADSRKNTIQTMDTMLFEKDLKLTAAYAEVDELRDRGFTLSDETLTDLEELTTKAKNLVKTASNRATDAFVIIGDIDSVLDNIRTER